MRRWAFLWTVHLGCAATPIGSTSAESPPPEPVTPPPGVTAELVAQPLTDYGPVGRGELPWWHTLVADTYQFDGTVAVLAVGDSADHHHIAEGFMKAKVSARIAVRKASERIGFSASMPEPEMLDLFVTREHRFLALYRIEVPEDAKVLGTPAPLTVPHYVSAKGQHRIGRHVFDGSRHLYLECDVEGPIANPDWGRSRASARN